MILQNTSTPTPPPKKTRRIWLYLVIFLVFVLAACAGALFASTSLLDKKELAPEEEHLLTAKDKATIMIMGVDQRADDVGRSDTLMIATIDPKKNQAALLSLPLTLALEGAGALTDPALLNHSKWDILYTAVASSGIAFFLQGWAQRHVAATPAAIILSMESLFALAAGWLILDDPATPLMLTGCALLFAAMTVAQLEPPKP